MEKLNKIEKVQISVTNHLLGSKEDRASHNLPSARLQT